MVIKESLSSRIASTLPIAVESYSVYQGTESKLAVQAGHVPQISFSFKFLQFKALAKRRADVVLCVTI